MPATGEQLAAIGASAMRKAFWRIIPLILVADLFADMDQVNAALIRVLRGQVRLPAPRAVHAAV